MTPTDPTGEERRRAEVAEVEQVRRSVQRRRKARPLLLGVGMIAAAMAAVGLLWGPGYIIEQIPADRNETHRAMLQIGVGLGLAIAAFGLLGLRALLAAVRPTRRDRAERLVLRLAEDQRGDRLDTDGTDKT
jgi:hypothetical protein